MHITRRIVGSGLSRLHNDGYLGPRPFGRHVPSRGVRADAAESPLQASRGPTAVLG